MNDLQTKLKKRISEMVMDLQSIDQKVSGLLQKRWDIEQKIQRLLRGEVDESQLKFKF